MAKIKVPIIISTKGFIIPKSQTNENVTIMPDNVRFIPNIPFYHMIWEDMIESKGLFHFPEPNVTEVKNFINEQYGLVKKVVPVFLTPSDSIGVDDRMIEQYFLSMGIKKTYVVRQSSLFKSLSLNYVAITVSERIISIEKYNNGNSQGIEYFNVHSFLRDEVESCVNLSKRSINSTEVFISDPTNKINELSGMGKIFNTQALLELAKRKIHDEAI